MGEDRVDMVLGPGGVDHDEACLAEGICVVVHEDSVVPGGQLSGTRQTNEGDRHTVVYHHLEWGMMR